MNLSSTSNITTLDELAQRIYSANQPLENEIHALIEQILNPGSQSPDLTAYRERVLSNLVAPGELCFGVTRDHARSVLDRLMVGLDSQFSLVGHVNPDYDCMASLLMMQQVVRHLDSVATIHVHNAGIEALKARTPNAVRGLLIEDLPNNAENCLVVLLDAIDPHASNVRLSESINPYLVLDNHRGEIKGEYGFTFPNHVALSTAIAGILVYNSPAEHFASPEFAIQAAFATLAIYTDSGEFMRANQHDWEALRVLLPFADPAILAEFSCNSLEAEAARLVDNLMPYKAATADLSLIAAQLPQLRNRDLGGAAADLMMRQNPELSACLLTAPESPIEIGGVVHEQTRGFLRVRSNAPHAPEIFALAEATFNGRTFGTRGLEVVGGVARRILVPEKCDRASLSSEMIERFLLRGIFPE